MSLDNTRYIYDHLPERYRRNDGELLLYRIVEHFGVIYDSFDEAFESFSESIESGTASAEWVTFWLKTLFGWEFLPFWFTTADKRNLYGNFGQHLARRGTARGIELFLKDFGITARVHKRALAWGEFVWGEALFSIAQPLYLIVEILNVRIPSIDASFYGEGSWGESYYSIPIRPLTEHDIIQLIRFQQPNAQSIDIFWKIRSYEPNDYTPYWGQIGWGHTYWTEDPEW